MRSPLGALCVLIAGTLGCATLAERAERVRVGVIGLEAAQVHDCLGDPLQLMKLGGEEHQLWVYREPVRGSYRQNIGTGLGAGDISRGIRSPSGGMARFAGSPAVSGAPDRPRAAPPEDASESLVGQCRIEFEIRDGTVSGFKAAGTDTLGFPVADPCALAAEHCLPDDRQGAAPEEG